MHPFKIFFCFFYDENFFNFFKGQHFSEKLLISKYCISKNISTLVVQNVIFLILLSFNETNFERLLHNYIFQAHNPNRQFYPDESFHIAFLDLSFLR